MPRDSRAFSRTVLPTQFVRLFMVSAALGVLPFLLLTAGARRHFSPETYRQLVLWGIPAITALGGFVLFPRLPCEVAAHGLDKKRRWVIPLCFAAFIIDYHFLPIGRATRLLEDVVFHHTVGGRNPLHTLWALPLCLIAGVFAFERTLRAGLCSAWSARIPVVWALVLTCVIGTMLSLGGFKFNTGYVDFRYSVATLVVVLSREFLFGLIFLASRSIWPGGLYRGLMFYIEAFILGDANSFMLPAGAYVSSQTSFYLLRASTAILATAAFAIGMWRTMKYKHQTIEGGE